MLRRAVKTANFAAWDARAALKGTEKLLKDGKLNKHRLKMLENAAATKKQIAHKAAKMCYHGVWGLQRFKGPVLFRPSPSAGSVAARVTGAATSVATFWKDTTTELSPTGSPGVSTPSADSSSS